LAAGPGRKPWGSTIDQRTSAARAAHGARVRAGDRAAAEAQRAVGTEHLPAAAVARDHDDRELGRLAEAGLGGAIGPGRARPGAADHDHPLDRRFGGDRRGGHHHRGQDDERAHDLGMRDRGGRRKPRPRTALSAGR
jgi:hypothetical protein